MIAHVFSLARGLRAFSRISIQGAAQCAIVYRAAGAGMARAGPSVLMFFEPGCGTVCDLVRLMMKWRQREAQVQVRSIR